MKKPRVMHFKSGIDLLVFFMLVLLLSNVSFSVLPLSFQPSVIEAKAADSNTHYIALFWRNWTDPYYNAEFAHIKSILDVLNADYIVWNLSTTRISQDELLKYNLTIYPVGDVESTLSSNERDALKDAVWNQNQQFLCIGYYGTDSWWGSFFNIQNTGAYMDSYWNVQINDDLYPSPSLFNLTETEEFQVKNSPCNSQFIELAMSRKSSDNSYYGTALGYQTNSSISGKVWYMGLWMAKGGESYLNLAEEASSQRIYMNKYLFVYVINELYQEFDGKWLSYFSPGIYAHVEVDDVTMTNTNMYEWQSMIYTSQMYGIKLTLGVVADVLYNSTAVYGWYLGNRSYVEIIPHGYNHTADFYGKTDADESAYVSLMKNKYASTINTTDEDYQSSLYTIAPNSVIDTTGTYWLTQYGYVLDMVEGWSALSPNFEVWKMPFEVVEGQTVMDRKFMYGETYDITLAAIKTRTLTSIFMGRPAVWYCHIGDFTGPQSKPSNLTRDWTQWLNDSGCDIHYLPLSKTIESYAAFQYDSKFVNGIPQIILPSGRNSFNARAIYNSSFSVNTTNAGNNYIIYDQAFSWDKQENSVRVTQRQRENVTSIALIPWEAPVYIKETTEPITSASYADDQLRFIIANSSANQNVASVSIFCAEKGQPEIVKANGISTRFNFDEESKILSFNVSLSGQEEIAVSWVSTPAYDLSLESKENTGTTANLGSVDFDYALYPLPSSISKTEADYQASYTASVGYVFDHWETDGSVSVSDPISNPTMVSLTDNGTLKAVYKLRGYNVALESRENTGLTVNLGLVTFNGMQYLLPNEPSEYTGNYEAQYVPSAGYEFVQWETSGEISVSDVSLNPTGVAVIGDGTLRAVYRQVTYNVTLESSEDNAASTNLGTMILAGSAWTLPQSLSKPSGNYSLQYIGASGYAFDHWETTGGISVSSTDVNPTITCIVGEGSLKAVYKTAPHSEAYIYISHTYIGDLVVTVGVGNTSNPLWSQVVWNRQGGATRNLNLTVDLSTAISYLPPLDAFRWYLKVYDAAYGDQGQITLFSIVYQNQTYSSTDVPVPVNDLQTSYAYIPGLPPPLATANIFIEHTYIGDLVVTIGVGDPNSPNWSQVVWNRQGGATHNLNLTIDLSNEIQYLPPSSNNTWYLKVYDAAKGDQGQIVSFTITYDGHTYTSTSVPVPIYDFQTSYAYIQG